jgi:hypothetical protein
MSSGNREVRAIERLIDNPDAGLHTRHSKWIAPQFFHSMFFASHEKVLDLCRNFDFGVGGEELPCQPLSDLMQCGMGFLFSDCEFSRLFRERERSHYASSYQLQIESMEPGVVRKFLIEVSFH